MTGKHGSRNWTVAVIREQYHPCQSIPVFLRPQFHYLLPRYMDLQSKTALGILIELKFLCKRQWFHVKNYQLFDLLYFWKILVFNFKIFPPLFFPIFGSEAKNIISNALSHIQLLSFLGKDFQHRKPLFERQSTFYLSIPR